MANPREVAQDMAQSMRKILESGKEAIPICVIVPKTGKSIIVGFEFPKGAPEAKDQAAQFMQRMQRDPEVDYVIFLSDAWCAKAVTQEEYQKYGSVEAMPGRSEGILVNVFGRERFTELGAWRYRRENGKLIFETPQIEWYDKATQVEGRFVPEERHAKQ